MKNIVLAFTLSLFFLIIGCKKDEGLTDADHKAKFMKAMGTNAQGVDLKQTADGGYILLGVTQGAGSQDIYMKKVDAFGNSQWSKTFDGPLGGSNEEVAGVNLLSDGRIVVAGATLDTVANGDEISSTFLLATDPEGNKILFSTYNDGIDTNDYIQNEICFCIDVNANDDILLVSEKNVLNISTNVELIASHSRLIDASNFSLKRFDESDVTISGAGKDIKFRSGLISSNNDLVISGTTNKDSQDESESGFLLNVIQPEGSGSGLLKDLQFGNSNEIGKTIIETENLEMVIAGSVDGGGVKNIWVTKFNDVLASSPIPSWEFTNVKSGNQEINKIIEVDGGYVLAGYSEISNDRQFYIVKIDKNGSSIIWEKEYGFVGFDEAKAIIATDDNGLAVLGSSSDERGNLVMTLLKLDSGGNLK